MDTVKSISESPAPNEEMITPVNKEENPVEVNTSMRLHTWPISCSIVKFAYLLIMFAAAAEIFCRRFLQCGPLWLQNAH